MSTPNEIAELLRQGIDAAREGRRTEARELFEQVVELDEKNEKGWFWLASVVESDEERRICLKNVLTINPNNDRAKKALEQVEAKLREQVDQEEVAPGVTRRQVLLIAGGGALVVLLVVVVVLTIVINNNNREQTIAAAQTQGAIAITETVNALNQNLTNEALAATAAQETAVALASPTPTPTNTPAFELPPTWTPTPAAEQVQAAGNAALYAPPASLAGVLTAWSGRDVASNGFLPIGYFQLEVGLDFNRVGSEVGSDVRLLANGQTMVHTRYDNLLFSNTLERININGTSAETLSERWTGSGILRAEQPDFAPDGNSVVFIGFHQDAPEQARVYALTLLELPPDAAATMAVRLLTSDSANYGYPEYSPDGSQIAAVRTDPSTGSTDIIRIDIASGGLLPVTTDASATTETHPRWHPNSSQIIYAAAPANAPENYDILIRNADASGTPLLLVRDEASDLYPVLSEDGAHLAFSSNRSGAYEIYILNIATQELSQLTNNGQENYPGDWWQP